VVTEGRTEVTPKRYRLRTLVILTALGRPVLAGLWFSAPYLPDVLAVVFFLAIALLGAMIAFAVLVAAVLNVPLLLGWVFSLIASGLIRLLVSPENRP